MKSVFYRWSVSRLAFGSAYSSESRIYPVKESLIAATSDIQLAVHNRAGFYGHGFQQLQPSTEH